MMNAGLRSEMLRKTRHVIRRPILLYAPWLRFVSPLRRLRLLAQVKINGASVFCAEDVVFQHPVEFQGAGRLILSGGAQLGYRGAGHIRTPILLQPRDAGSEIRIGRKSAVMNGSELIARTSISIGQDCLIGPGTVIIDADFHGIAPDARLEPGLTLPVVIGDNVFVGTGAMILKGVQVGSDAVIAAGCVVSKDVPAGAKVAGNPMKIIGSVYPD